MGETHGPATAVSTSKSKKKSRKKGKAKRKDELRSDVPMNSATQVQCHIITMLCSC